MILINENIRPFYGRLKNKLTNKCIKNKYLPLNLNA